MMEVKRKAEDYHIVPQKKTRHEVCIPGTREKAIVNTSVPRTSDLQAPIMLLEGHSGELYSVRFHPHGQHLASAGFDRQILVWNVFGACENVLALRGHSGAVLDLAFSADGAALYSASADGALAVWDLRTGRRTRRLRGHAGHVNAVAATARGTDALASAGDDGRLLLWDPRRREPVAEMPTACPATAIALAPDGSRLYSGGLDGAVRSWEPRAAREGRPVGRHADTVTGLAAAGGGGRLASAGADCVRVWEAGGGSRVSLSGSRGAEGLLLRPAWGRGGRGGPDGERVACGSACGHALVWCAREGRLRWRLPGHRAAVTAVDLHPEQPVLASAGADGLVYLGELPDDD